MTVARMEFKRLEGAFRRRPPIAAWSERNGATAFNYCGVRQQTIVGHNYTPASNWLSRPAIAEEGLNLGT